MNTINIQEYTFVVKEIQCIRDPFKEYQGTNARYILQIFLRGEEAEFSFSYASVNVAYAEFNRIIKRIKEE